jgi:hypothetical protein
MWALGGFGRSFSKDEELVALKHQASFLKDELDAIQALVQDLDSKEEGK